MEVAGLRIRPRLGKMLYDALTAALGTRGPFGMIEIVRWSLHVLLWASEFIFGVLLLAWLYYSFAIEPRIRRKNQTKPNAGSDQS